LDLSESFSDLSFGDKRRKHHVEGEKEGSDPTDDAQNDERPSKAIPTKTKDVSLCKMIVQSTDQKSRKKKDRNTCSNINRSVNQSISQSVNPSTDQPTEREERRGKQTRGGAHQRPV